MYFVLGADRNSTPHAMQWAIRANTQSRPSAPQTTGGGGGGSGFIYVDSASLRRGGSNAAAAASTGTSDLGPGTSGPHSMSSSASALARAFGIVVREVGSTIICDCILKKHR